MNEFDLRAVVEGCKARLYSSWNTAREVSGNRDLLAVLEPEEGITSVFCGPRKSMLIMLADQLDDGCLKILNEQPEEQSIADKLWVIVLLKDKVHVIKLDRQFFGTTPQESQSDVHKSDAISDLEVRRGQDPDVGPHNPENAK